MTQGVLAENPPTKSVVDLDDMARWFGVTHPTIRTWEKAGYLPPSIQLGRRRYWRRSDVEALWTGRTAQ